MNITIHRPKLLLAILALLLVGAIAYPVLADNADPDTASIPVALDTEIPVTEADIERARALIDGRIRALNGGQDFEFTFTYIDSFPDRRWMHFTVVWSDPANTTGPWHLVRCQGTVDELVEIETLGVRGVTGAVDLASGDELYLINGGRDPTLAGSLLPEQEPVRHTCPPGLHDD